MLSSTGVWGRPQYSKRIAFDTMKKRFIMGSCENRQNETSAFAMRQVQKMKNDSNRKLRKGFGLKNIKYQTTCANRIKHDFGTNTILVCNDTCVKEGEKNSYGDCTFKECEQYKPFAVDPKSPQEFFWTEEVIFAIAEQVEPNLTAEDKLKVKKLWKDWKKKNLWTQTLLSFGTGIFGITGLMFWYAFTKEMQKDDVSNSLVLLLAGMVLLFVAAVLGLSTSVGLFKEKRKAVEKKVQHLYRAYPQAQQILEKIKKQTIGQYS